MTDSYTPPKVWTWDQANGGEFASINRPNAGATHDKALPVGKHPLQLYSLATPNGQKVTILLEELLALGKDAEYDAWLIRIGDGDQFGSGFVSANPNSKIPAMMDHSISPALRVFESGSILVYLAEKFGAFLPTDPRARIETMNWLFWQMGSAPFLGGGFGHFYAYAPEKFEYPINRYAMEAKRQLDVLDRHLADHPFMAGEAYTIADMAIWPWYGRLVMGEIYGDAGTFLDGASYTHVMRWAREIAARPAVQRGVMVNRTSGEASGQLWERHDASDFDNWTQDKALEKLTLFSASDVVAFANELKNAGMNDEQLTAIHHSQKESFDQTLGYFSKHDSLGSDTNKSYAARLYYIVEGRKKGGTWDSLVERANRLYPHSN